MSYFNEDGRDFKPSQLIGSLSNVSGEQAKQISADVMNAVQANLGKYKELAGGGQPWDGKVRTMQRMNNDMNLGLERVKNYASLTGRIPNLDAIKAYGLEGTFGDVAGQDTFDTQLQKQQMALARAKASASSGNGGSGFTPWQLYQIMHNAKNDESEATDKAMNRAIEAAKNDPRVGQPRWETGWFQEDAPVWSMNDIIDAYYQQYKNGSGKGSQDDEIWNLLNS